MKQFGLPFQENGGGNDSGDTGKSMIESVPTRSSEDSGVVKKHGRSQSVSNGSIMSSSNGPSNSAQPASSSQQQQQGGGSSPKVGRRWVDFLLVVITILDPLQRNMN